MLRGTGLVCLVFDGLTMDLNPSRHMIVQSEHAHTHMERIGYFQATMMESSSTGNQTSIMSKYYKHTRKQFETCRKLIHFLHSPLLSILRSRQDSSC